MTDTSYNKTIESRQSELKQKFIEALKEMPIIEVACNKAGIGRTTHHRWIKEDDDFRTQANDAMADGRERINDMSEAQIVQLIKKEKLPAISLWLKHNSPRYGGKAVRGPSPSAPALTPQEERLFKKAMAISSGVEIKRKNHAKPRTQKSEGNTGKPKAPKTPGV